MTSFLADGPIPDPHGKGDRAVRFIRNLRLHEGKRAGQPFPLDAWQERIIRRIYGDTDERGLRKIRTVFMLLPRGNGKTTLGAALGLLHLFGPAHEAGGQCICAAADREQASIAFRTALRMVQQDAHLTRITRARESQKQLEHPKSGSIYRAISHEAYTKHGLSVSFLLADEIHAWPSRELWEVLTTSMGKREEPLSLVITTAGKGVNTLAFELYDYARKVDAGLVDDPTFLPILFEPEPGADWRDEDLWRRVNPALASGFRSLEEMRVSARQAAEVPAQRVAFQQLYLNLWQDGAPDPAFDLSIWDECSDSALSITDFLGEPCWVGVDLSKTTDLTAVSACFIDDHGRFVVFPFAFAPRENIARRASRDRVPYDRWAAEGHLTATAGDVVDLDVVEAKVRELHERFSVQEVCFDPWQARKMMTALLEDGIPAVELRQNFGGMSGPVKDFERALLSRKIRHAGHPVLRWCVGNLVLAEDAAGNVRPNKSRSTERIDLAVATIMALGRAAAGGAGPSVYENAEARPGGLLFV
jgi:phage terminase large subunit-like protein